MGSMLGQSTGGIHGQKNAATNAQNQQQFTTFRPEDVAALQGAQQGLVQQTQQQQNLTNALQQQAAQGAPSLNSQYNQFSQYKAAPPGQLDALGKNLVTQGTQQLQQVAGAQQRALAQQFGGQPGIAQALGRQAAMNARLQANPLLMQAAQGSSDRGFQIGQAQQNAQQLSNQALLQQAQAAQTTRQEQAGYGQQGLQSQQALLPIFSQLAQQFGTQNTTGVQNQNTLQGGVKQNAFNK